MRKQVELELRRSGQSWTRRVFGQVLPPAVVVVVFLALWQIIAAHNPQAIPSLGAIWRTLIHEPNKFFENSLTTIEEMVVGLVASAIVAFSLAVLMIHLRVVERAVMPLAVILNVTPVVAFAPGLVLIFSYTAPRYIVTGVIVFFPFLINSFVGLREIDREALDFFRTLDASRTQILWRLRLPSSLPYLFAAARICVPLSLVGAVVAEFTSSGGSNLRGLGSLIEFDYSYLNLPEVYASVFCLAVIGIVSSSLVVFGERRFLRWNRMARA